MATASTPSGTAPSAALKAYEDKVNAQIREAKAKLEQVEASAKEQLAQAQIKTIDQLKTTRQNLERKVRDLKTTHEANLEHAKADLTAEIAKFTASIDQLATEFKAAMKE
jgi:hypothetical protein